jgi:DNA-directed RNA polymerase specialized sigma subunit
MNDTDSLTAELGKQLHTSLENGGHALDLGAAISHVTAHAAEHPLQWSERQQRAVTQYIEALHEPQRTMFYLCQAGRTVKSIARSLGLGPTSVCRSLAKIYSNIRVIAKQEETSV